MNTSQPTLAKLTPPRLPKIIDRTRLYRRLDDARKQRPIIWISGPPGIGKTTLIASYLRTRKLKPLWYQVDQGDADLATFFHYLGLACRQVAPRYRRPLPHLTPEYLQGLPTFTRRYFESLYGRIKIPGILVFDNIQEVPSSSPLHEMLSIGFEAIVPGLSVMVISRENPPSPYAKLQATQLVEHITQDELRLTPTETAGIVRLWHQSQFKTLSKNVIEQLQTKVDGWAAGLVLVLEQTKTKNPLDVILQGKTPQVLFDYLATEVFQQLELRVQDFLLRIAVLPWATGPMARELTGQDDAEEVLSELFHRRYFTERREEAHPVYQFHPLFKEFLLAWGRNQFSDQEVIQLNEKGAVLFETAEHIDEALELYQKAGAINEVVRLILTHAPMWIKQGRSEMLGERIKRVPNEIRGSIPWLVFWQGCAFFGLNIQYSQTLFEEAVEKFEFQKDFVGFGLAWSCLVQAVLFRWDDLKPLDGLLQHYENVVPRDFQFPNPNIESQVTFAMFTALMWRNSEYKKMQRWEKRASQLLGNTDDPNQLAAQALALTTYYQWMGRLAEIQEVLTRVRNLVPAQSAGPFFQAMLLFIEAHYKWMRGEGTQCIRLAEKVEELAKQSGIEGGLLISNRAAKVLGALTNGDTQEAELYLEKNSICLKNTSLMVRGFHHFQMGWVTLLNGDFEQAKYHAEFSMDEVLEYAGPFPASQHYIAACYANQALGNYKQANEYHAKAMTVGESMESPVVLVMAGFAQAHLEFEQGNQTAGLVALQRAMRLSRQFEIVAFGWFLPSVIVRLCMVALEQNIEVEYAQRLIRLHRLVPSKSPESIFNWPWPVKIWTLKPFGIHINDKPLEFSHKVPRKPLELLKALIAFGGQDVSESQLIDALWPDAEGDKGQEVFLKTLNRLRKIIGIEGLLQIRERKVSLDSRQCWVDVWAFEAFNGTPSHMKRSEEHRSKVRILEKSLALYTQPFLANEEVGWTQGMQERLRVKYSQGVLTLSRHYIDLQEWDKAETWLERGIEVEPTSEEMYQELIAGLLQQGRRVDAAQVFDRCRNMFIATFGMEPSVHTQHLLSINEHGREKE